MVSKDAVKYIYYLQCLPQLLLHIIYILGSKYGSGNLQIFLSTLKGRSLFIVIMDQCGPEAELGSCLKKLCKISLGSCLGRRLEAVDEPHEDIVKALQEGVTY